MLASQDHGESRLELAWPAEVHVSVLCTVAVCVGFFLEAMIFYSLSPQTAPNCFGNETRKCKTLEIMEVGALSGTAIRGRK